MSIVSGECLTCGAWGVLSSIDQCWDCQLAQYQTEERARQQRRDAVYGAAGSYRDPVDTGQWEPRPLSWTPRRTGPPLAVKLVIFLVLLVVVVIGISHLV
jgi:hypothetical protein